MTGLFLWLLFVGCFLLLLFFLPASVPVPMLAPKEFIPPPAVLTPLQVPKQIEKKKKYSKGETICRQFLESHYGVPFADERPNWLINPETGHALELDCYNADLKIAVEYNGIQHYEFPNHFHKKNGKDDWEAFRKQITRDEDKKRICNEHGVYLISVPYKIKYRDIAKFIWRRLPENYRP